MKSLRQTFRIAIFSLIFIPSLSWAADEIVIVLSSNLKPYQEALAGFRQEFGKEIPSFVLSEKEPKIPKNTRVVVTIGGKAALYHYPHAVHLIYCLSPGLLVPMDNYSDQPVQIMMLPAFYSVVAKFKAIQPSMKRLGVLYISDSVKDYFKEKEKISSELGVRLETNQMQAPEDLPEQLRNLKWKVDALWLPPDPSMISQASLDIIREFSWGNNIPFYAPSDGLVDHGAIAAVSSSFKEIGRIAAKIAIRAESGDSIPSVVYPEKLQVTINTVAAAKMQTTIPNDVIQKADRVVP